MMHFGDVEDKGNLSASPSELSLTLCASDSSCVGLPLALASGKYCSQAIYEEERLNIEHDSVKEAHVFNTGGENGLSHTEFEVGTTILQLAL
jgi:hypothetical protein